MKRTFVFFSLMILLFMPLSLTPCFSKLTTYSYAKIVKPETFLYKMQGSTIKESYILPETYFVLLLSNYNENYYKVMYRDEEGFVLKDDVMPVNENVSTPYLDSKTFTPFVNEGKMVYRTPNNSSSEIVSQVDLYSPISFYGYTFGTSIPGGNNIWYYGRSASGLKGYFYSNFCNQFDLNNLPKNEETVTKKDNVYFEDDSTYMYSLVNPSITLKITLILSIVVPTLILIFLIFKPFNIEKSKDKSEKKPKKIRKLKHIKNIKEDVI